MRKLKNKLTKKEFRRLLAISNGSYIRRPDFIETFELLDKVSYQDLKIVIHNIIWRLNKSK